MASIYEFDTIVALATPPGRSAIAILRISGSKSLQIARQLCNNTTWEPHPNVCYHRQICHPFTKQVLDDGILIFFQAPRSYTGEMMLEIHCHGNPMVIQQIRTVLSQMQIRTASPGEFTRRAFLNGKLDLSQAEAINEIIQATNPLGVHFALEKLNQKLSGYIHPIKTVLKEELKKIEAAIDHPEEEDVSHLFDSTSLIKKLEQQHHHMQRLMQQQQQTRTLQAGIHVVLIGKTNVGKSSLFNALLDDDRAIVTDQPGTTRDFLMGSIVIDQFPIILIDTAGFHAFATNEVEQLGIQRAKDQLNQADGIIWLIDLSRSYDKDDEEILNLLNQVYAHKPLCIIGNKKDLPRHCTLPKSLSVKPIFLSLVHNCDLHLIYNWIEQFIPQLDTQTGDALILLNDRQVRVLERGQRHLQQTIQAVQNNLPLDMVAQDVWDCVRALDEVTGETVADEILNGIFDTFCIGK